MAFRAFLALFSVALLFAWTTALAFLGAGEIAIRLGPLWGLLAFLLYAWWELRLPVTIGAFFGLMHIWGLHWAVALLAVAPTLWVILMGFTLVPIWDWLVRLVWVSPSES
jgi:hypothetical protein